MSKAEEITKAKLLAKLRAQLDDSKRRKKERYELHQRVKDELIEIHYRIANEADKRKVKSILARYNTGRAVTIAR